MRKAGHGGEKGVIMKQMCLGMCFVRANVHMCARSCTVFVLIVFSGMGPTSLWARIAETRCVWCIA